MLIIPSWEAKKIFDHAKKDYPKECCGMLFGRPNKDFICYSEPLTNIEKKHPEAKFEISVEEHLAFQKKSREDGFDIFGFYHSHPNGTTDPSLADLRLAWEGWYYAIVSVNQNQEADMKVYQLDESRKQFRPIEWEDYPS